MEEQSNKLAITTGSWVRGASVLAVVFVLFLVRDVILILLTSIVIASAVEPATTWAKNKNIPRIPTVLSLYIFAALIFVGLFYFLFLPLVGDLANLLQRLPDYSEKIAYELTNSTFFGFDFRSLTVSVNDVAGYLNSFLGKVSTGALSSVSAIFGGITSFVLIIVLSFYLAVQDDGVGKFLKIITPWKHENYVVGLWKRSQRKIGRWMQGQLLLAVIVMVLVYLGLLLIGLEHALLLAVLSGVFEIIPLFGPVLAAIPAVLVAFASGGTTLCLIVIGLYLIIQQFENHLIYPLVVKKVVGVPPMISIIALLVGAKLAGFLGMIIAVPLVAILMELLEDMERSKLARHLKEEVPSV